MAASKLASGLFAFFAAVTAVAAGPVEAQTKSNSKAITPQVFLIDMVSHQWMMPSRDSTDSSIVST